MSKPDNKLLLYKASAGSGKTHFLSQTYTDYLLDQISDISSHNRNDDWPYKHILAVTFTNAATQEMKERILYMIDQVAHDKDQSPKRQKYAQILLKKIVHDYSMFRVSTIDSFFQTILRSFAFEMGRSSSYDVSLDSETALEQALASLYEKIEENPNILNTITRISLDQLREEKSWDFRERIRKFCDIVLSNDYTKIKAELETEDSKYEDVINRLNIFNKNIVQRAYNIHKRIIDYFQAHHIEREYFVQKSRSFVYKFLTSYSFYLDPTSSSEKFTAPFPIEYFEKLFEFEQWIRSDAPSESHEKGKEIYNALLNDIRELHDLLKNNQIKYFSNKEILNNLRQTSLLTHIEEYLQDYCKRENITLLSESSFLIKKLIDGGDLPFIYEKIGVKIDHFLLDEFQDTSWIQWDNFSPLLKESLAHNNKNLIVGDVKQSIYRWRGGDWEILNSQIENDPYFSQYVEKKIANKNYRSLQNIIQFNNSFFSKLPHFLKNNIDILSDDILNIYSDVEQTCARQNDSKTNSPCGYIEVISHNSAKDSIINNGLFICKKLLQIINKLTVEAPIERRYKKNELGILVDTNRNGNLIAKYLLQNGINVVSSDSVKIGSSDSVFTIINILKYIVDKEYKGLYIFKQLNNIKLRDEDGLSLLSSSTPLYETSLQIINNHLPEQMANDTIFISAFLDKVLEYSTQRGASIHGFIKWWEENSDNFSISSPADEDAVNIQTIHKSKGLAYKVVLLPYLKDTALFNIKDPKWCKVDSSDPIYSKPRLISLSKEKSVNTYYIDYYNQEYEKSIIDTINMLYVAFTRPKEKLYIFSFPGDKNVNKSSMKFLSDFCQNNQVWRSVEHSITKQNYKSEYDFSDEEIDLDATTPFDYICYTNGCEDESISEYFKSKVENKEEQIHIGRFEINESAKKELRITKFGQDDDMRHKGILLHELYSYMNHCSPKEAVDRLIASNPSYRILSPRLEASPEQLREDLIRMVEKQLSTISSRDWFSEKYEVINEVEILNNGHIYRPDRVIVDRNNSKAIVVDYKFGHEKLDKYSHQVKKYMQLLQKMGYEKIEGFVWYVENQEIIQVDF